MTIKTTDGKEFNPTEAKLVSSVDKVRSRDFHKPPRLGEFPVFVEQSGKYRLFIYNRKLVEM